MPPTTTPDLAGYKKVGPPGSGAPDLSQFKKNVTRRAFRFELPTQAEDREAKIAGLQEEASAAQKESERANSFAGMAGAFGQDIKQKLPFVGGAFALGEKVLKPMLSTDPSKNAEAVKKLTTSQVSLLKQIRAKEEKGEDATKLKQIYNSQQDLIDQEQGAIQEYAANLPTTATAAGALGSTALDVLTAGTYGKAATAGMQTGKLSLGASRAALPGAVKTLSPAGKATGILSAGGLGRVATGGGIGYASDVTQGLMGNRGEDREGAKAFIPGAGTAIGALIPAALETEKTITNVTSGLARQEAAQKLVAKREKAFQDLIDRGVKTKNLDTRMQAKGHNPSMILSQSDDFIPEVNNGVINSDAAVNKIQEATDPMAKLVRAVIESEDKRIPFDDFQKQAIDQLDTLKLRGDEYNRVKANVMSDMDFYRTNYADDKGMIPLTIIDDIKKAKYGEINWANPDLYTADRAISRSARRTIEDSTPGNLVRDMNEELGKLYDAQEMLETLNGRAVKGGRLGKYFARGIGSAIGSSHGPGGAVVGMLSADKIADLQQSAYFQNPIVKAAVGELKTTQPAVFQEAQDILAQRAADAANRPLLGLPASGGSPINQGRVIPVMPTDKVGAEPSLMSSDVSIGNYKPPSPAPTGVPTEPLGAAVGQQYLAETQMPVIHADGTASMADAQPVEQAQFVADTIKRHLNASRQVVENLDKVEFEKLGGMPELLARTRTNIADGLAADGLPQVAEEVRKIPINDTDTLAQLLQKLAGAARVLTYWNERDYRI